MKVDQCAFLRVINPISVSNFPGSSMVWSVSRRKSAAKVLTKTGPFLADLQVFLAISGPRLSGIRGHTILVSALATIFQKIKRLICVRHVIASQAVEVPQVANMKRILAF